MTTLTYKAVGSEFTYTDWNLVCDKLSSGIDGIYTGSAVISGTTNPILSPAGTGSPITWGRFIQAGSGTVGAGSDLWLVFPVGFGTTPIVTVSKRAQADGFWHITGSLSAGSAYVQGETASTIFDWMAIG